MKIGTRSVLFGAHAFWLHPFVLAYAWWKLYGWRPVPALDGGKYSLRDPWLWVAFFVHDLGYVGKPNMDGEEGEAHPWFGARVLYWLQGLWVFLLKSAWQNGRTVRTPIRWWHIRRKWACAHLDVAQQRVIWGNESLYHSRFLAKRYSTQFSKLCVADKLSIALVPWWVYVPMCRLTREIHEYSSQEKHRGDMARTQNVQNWGESHSFAAHKDWFLKLQDHMRKLIESGQLEVESNHERFRSN